MFYSLFSICLSGKYLLIFLDKFGSVQVFYQRASSHSTPPQKKEKKDCISKSKNAHAPSVDRERERQRHRDRKRERETER